MSPSGGFFNHIIAAANTATLPSIMVRLTAVTHPPWVMLISVCSAGVDCSQLQFQAKNGSSTALACKAQRVVVTVVFDGWSKHYHARLSKFKGGRAIRGNSILLVWSTNMCWQCSISGAREYSRDSYLFLWHGSGSQWKWNESLTVKEASRCRPPTAPTNCLLLLS